MTKPDSFLLVADLLVADLLVADLLVADDGGEVVGMAIGMQGLADDGAGPAVPGLCHYQQPLPS